MPAPSQRRKPSAKRLPALRKVEGRVLIQIIVNADGSADMASFKVLESDHQLFTEAVKTALAAGRFSSATVQGKAVRELMLLPFEFVPRN